MGRILRPVSFTQPDPAPPVTLVNGDFDIIGPDTSVIVGAGDVLMPAPCWIFDNSSSGASYSQLDVVQVTSTTDIPFSLANKITPKSYLYVLAAVSAPTIGATEKTVLENRVEKVPAAGAVETTSYWSFFARANGSVTVPFYIQIYTGTATYSIVFPVSLATNWNYFEFEVPKPPISVSSLQDPKALSFGIALRAGSGFQTSQQNQWVSGDFVALTSTSQFSNISNAELYVTGFRVSHSVNAPRVLTPPELVEVQTQRYYQSSYYLDVLKPGSVTRGNAYGRYERLYVPRDTVTYTVPLSTMIQFKTRMRTKPTVKIYSPNSGALGNVYDETAGIDRAVSALYVTDRGFALDFGTSGTSIHASVLYLDYEATATL